MIWLPLKRSQAFKFQWHRDIDGGVKIEGLPPVLLQSGEKKRTRTRPKNRRGLREGCTDKEAIQLYLLNGHHLVVPMEILIPYLIPKDYAARL